MDFDQALSILTHKAWNVLIVDDSEGNLALMELYFSKTACRTELARNGVEAVEMAASGNFDLIFMDIQMPTMDGYEATRRIREMEASKNAAPVPIVVITATVHAEEQERCFAAGCTAFLAKPIDKATLLVTAAELVPHQ